MNFTDHQGAAIELNYIAREYKTPHKRARLFQIIKTGNDRNGNYDSYVSEFTAKGQLVRVVHMTTSRPSMRSELVELPSYFIKSREEFRENFEGLACQLLRDGKGKEIISSDC